MGDNEQRWYLWYSGSSAPMEGLAGVAAAAGSVGKPPDNTCCCLIEAGPIYADTQMSAASR